ncbi:MAG: LysR family transcriptional regulator [Blautia hansenii]
MELRNINTFLKVAATQNFSKAAEQLGYSQSAVTVQIQQLEKELETPLFERIGKRVFLTERGMEFTSYANEIMGAANRARFFAKEKGELDGTLRIGGVESVCTAMLPDFLLTFHSSYPRVKITIKSGTTEELMEMARSNEIDFVFTLDRKICSGEWVKVVERKEHILFVTLAEQLQERKEQIPIQELAKKPFLLTELGAAYQYELERLLSERDLEIMPILEIGNTETIIHLLRKGMGLSFLPAFTVKEELEKKRFSEVRTNLPSVVMYSQLLYCRNKWVTQEMQKFAELVGGRID